MSGAELALAIVPLVIVLVEHHQTVFRKGKALTLAKSKNDQQLDFFHELHDELTLLHMTLSRIRDRSALAGHRETLEESIKRALGKEAPHFQTILDRIMKSVNDLVSEKSVALSQRDTNNPGAMLSKLEHFKRLLDQGNAPSSFRDRFRFTRNEKSRTVALYKIQQGTKKLERLLGPSWDMFDQPSRKSRKKPSARRTRRHSEELYRKLCSKWPRPGANSIRHRPKLCIWNCCYDDGNQASDDSLDIIMSMIEASGSGADWQESTIQVKGSGQYAGHVRFAPSTNQTGEGRAAAVNTVEVDSLCEIFRQAKERNAKLQLLFEDGKLSQKRSTGTCLRIQNQHDVPLTSLLKDSSQRWTLKDKYVLAVVLAHAALHCPAGSWLRADWNKAHVSFFTQDATQQADLSRPFLTLDFESKPTTAGSLEPHPVLSSLGILLLEISQVTAMEDHHSADDLTDGQPNEYSNLTTAFRLLENWNADLVVNYRKAVEACLEWDTIHGDLRNEEFTQRMYEKIVEPLEKELQHGFQISPEDLSLIGVRTS